MCDFPSWIEDANGKAYFLTDKDAEALMDVHQHLTWPDMVGHAGVRGLYGEIEGGRECERSNVHRDVLTAIAEGRMRRLAKTAGYDSVVVSGYVEVRDGSHLALGRARVTAMGSSHVTARDSSHVTARDSSHVTAMDSSHVTAWDSSHVTASCSSHVTARDSSHVTASCSSHVWAWDSSQVTASGSSRVDDKRKTKQE